MSASITTRLARSLRARLRTVRAAPALSPTALQARWAAHTGGYPVDEAGDTHLEAALAWLVRAQDATPDDGFSRGYSLTWNSYFGCRGWQPSYPETTGYIIPTLYGAARRLDRAELAERAARAAYWEIEVQLPSGAIPGGVVGQPRSPAVFNTGQVVFGWLCALDETGDAAFAEAAARACDYLASAESGGRWVEGESRFARPGSPAYNARTAWALVEAGTRLGRSRWVAAGERVLQQVAAEQAPSGWFPNCCLSDPRRPLLHTLAYTIRGLVEGGRVLGNAALIESAARGAALLAAGVRADGWMSGRFWPDGSPAVRWSCLTGQAQMANNWMRLYRVTGESRWLEPVPRVLRFLEATQSRHAADPGLRGGILGSAPVNGEYGRDEVLNWATKFFADALMRHTALLRPDVAAEHPTLA